MEEQIVAIHRNIPIGNYKNLSSRLQRAHWDIIQTIVCMKPVVRVSIENADELLDVHDAIRYDYPELDVIWDYDRSFYVLTPANTTGRKMELFMTYKGSRDEISSRLRKIEAKAEEIIYRSTGGRGLSDDEMVKAIYHYMAEHYFYSAKLENGGYPGDSYTLECLLKGNGVCAGMAAAMTYILHKLNIPVITVAGDADGREWGGHAWNIVQLSNGRYGHIDLTWDLGKDKDHMKYLGLDDIAMRARRHFWNTRAYPPCTE